MAARNGVDGWWEINYNLHAHLRVAILMPAECCSTCPDQTQLLWDTSCTHAPWQNLPKRVCPAAHLPHPTARARNANVFPSADRFSDMRNGAPAVFAAARCVAWGYAICHMRLYLWNSLLGKPGRQSRASRAWKRAMWFYLQSPMFGWRS